MTYTTLTFNGTEKSLADWGVGKWRREVFNQASDSFAFDLLAATDAAEIFPYGARVVIQTGRLPASGSSSTAAGLPLSGCTAWTGGQTWFVGWRAQNIRVGTAQMEGLNYKFAGPWDFFFERLVFQKLWLTWNGVKQIADWRSQVVLGMSVNALSGAGDTVSGTTTTNLMSISQQLIEIASYVAAQSSYEQSVNGLGWPAGGQIQFDSLTTDGSGNYHLLPAAGSHCQIPDFVPGFEGASGDTSVSTSGLMLRAPLDAVNDMTCAECFRRMLRWIGAVGSPVVWFDYTTAPPTLKVATRDVLPQVTLPLVGSTEQVRIQRRDDLIPSAIAFKYRISGQINGTPYAVIENDVAATVDGEAVEGIGLFGALTDLSGHGVSGDAQTALPLQARRLGAQIATFDFEGFSSNEASGSIATVALNLDDPSGGGSSRAFWTALFPELGNVTDLAFYQDNSGAVAPTVLDASGSAINPAHYPNILVEGMVAPWMYVNNTPSSNTPGSCVEARITAFFQYTDNATASGAGAAVNPGTVVSHQKTIRLKLTNLSTGTYQSRPQVTHPGEPVPYGLAGYIYGIEAIPQYQGSFTVVEQEITDVCALGHGLNLSGGLAEWGTMKACVQQVNYSDDGKTELVFGPAQHLGNADLVERLRVNRGPRWYNLIGNDLLNSNVSSGPVALGKNVPVAAPSHGNKVNTALLLPQSLKDLQTPHSYAFPPGVYLWAKGAQAGFSTLDDGPGLALGGGSGGTADTEYILISKTQLHGIISGKNVQFCELNTCEDGDATYYRTFLCTDKYHHI